MYSKATSKKSISNSSNNLGGESKAFLKEINTMQTWNGYMKAELKRLKGLFKGATWPNHMLNHLSTIDRSLSTIEYQARFYYDEY